MLLYKKVKIVIFCRSPGKIKKKIFKEFSGAGCEFKLSTDYYDYWNWLEIINGGGRMCSLDLLRMEDF